MPLKGLYQKPTRQKMPAPSRNTGDPTTTSLRTSGDPKTVGMEGRPPMPGGAVWQFFLAGEFIVDFPKKFVKIENWKPKPMNQ